MRGLQSWALAVCLACSAVGILQKFSSTGKSFSVINLVMLMYILVTALAPAEGREALLTSGFSDVMITETVQGPDPAVAALELAEKRLSQKAENELLQRGCRSGPVRVILGGSPDDLRITEVILTVPAGRAPEAEQVIRDLFGKNAEIRIEEKELRE